jgi:hypothetical protein
MAMFTSFIRDTLQSALSNRYYWLSTGVAIRPLSLILVSVMVLNC